MNELAPSLEEQEDVSRLIGAAFAASLEKNPSERQRAQHLVSGLAALVKAQYGALEHHRNPPRQADEAKK